MIGNKTLGEPLRDKSGGSGLVKQDEEALAKEINVLARILIDAVKEERRRGKTT